MGVRKAGLYYQGWLPEGELKAVLLVVHGLAEHSGRYMNLVNRFVPQGYAVYGIDHLGHGRSEGRRLFLERFADYTEPLKTYSDMVRCWQPDRPVFLVGHSMGGLIGALTCSPTRRSWPGRSSPVRQSRRPAISRQRSFLSAGCSPSFSPGWGSSAGGCGGYLPRSGGRGGVSRRSAGVSGEDNGAAGRGDARGDGASPAGSGADQAPAPDRPGGRRPSRRSRRCADSLRRGRVTRQAAHRLRGVLPRGVQRTGARPGARRRRAMAGGASCLRK